MELLQKSYRIISISFISVLFAVTANCQLPIANYELRILPLDADSAFLQKEVKFKTQFSDSSAIMNELQNVLQQLHNKAFLEASVDTVVRVGTIFVAMLHLSLIHICLYKN